MPPAHLDLRTVKDERAARLAYCREVLLPIWERWTDGNPALRRFLEGVDADPAGHEERLRLLIRTSGELRRRGGMSAGVAAAGLAAAACMKACVDVPESAWRRAAAQAAIADRDAHSPPTGGMPPE